MVGLATTLGAVREYKPSPINASLFGKHNPNRCSLKYAVIHGLDDVTYILMNWSCKLPGAPAATIVLQSGWLDSL